MNKNKLNLFKKVYVGILLVIFGGIVLHAPLSVSFGTIFSDCSLLIKSWKEILMLVAGVLALFLLYKNKKFKLLRDPIILAIGAYAILHLLLLIVFHNNLTSVLAGLAIDLRYVLFFALVYVALRLYPEYRTVFIKVGIAGALVVLIFALLQVFVLPHDILKYIGYNANTISPYLTVDQNNDFIRINSTLRGPNPLGAYVGIVLTLLVSAIARKKVLKNKRSLVLYTILLVGGAVALWASYSRSALVGAIISIGIVLAVTVIHKFSTKMWIISGVVLAVIGVGFLMTMNTPFVSNVLLHENPNDGNEINSNEGHIGSLQHGFNKAISKPLGAGIGSTGSASLYGNSPEIIENQYLFTAHESGWLGLGYFVFILGLILNRLWRGRKDWLALGVFASGIGLALIGLLLPVWVDDTVAIIWWGLAAVALCFLPQVKNHK